MREGSRYAVLKAKRTQQSQLRLDIECSKPYMQLPRHILQQYARTDLK